MALPSPGKQLHLTENWKQGRKGFKAWKSSTQIWLCKKNCRLQLLVFSFRNKKASLREDEIVQPTSRPVYKWRAERKR
ncbi:hypothetical protein BHM03_00042574 [Ensete ventricosum]|nr:hypothetical protein BHM03_00042574 [Ensete ventricosum]